MQKIVSFIILLFLAISLVFATHSDCEEDSDVVNAVVHGIILGVPAPFILSNPDGCLDSGLECPLKAEQIYTYITTLPILKTYPRVTVDVKWELQNKNEKNIVCVKIPSKLM